MAMRRLSGARTDETTAAVVARAEVLADQAQDPSAAVDELLTLAEGRQFILDTAYAIALRRHRGTADPELSVQLLEMASYTLQHRNRAGPRIGRILSYVNLLIRPSVMLVFLGITVWVARRAVVERNALLAVAVLFTAGAYVLLAYNTWRLTFLPDFDQLAATPRPPTASDTGRPKTIPQLIADTLETARRLAAHEAITTNPIEELVRAARGGQTGPVVDYRANVVLEESFRRASFIPPIHKINRRVYRMLRDAKQAEL